LKGKFYLQRHLSLSGKYKPELDGLRAIAVTLTVLAHTGNFSNYSKYGVDVFFVLSGWFISEVFLEKKLSVKDFLVNRFARLYPLVILYSIVAVIFSLRFRTPGAWEGSFASLLMVKNFQSSDSLFGHFWSLSGEFQFYILIAVMVSVLGHSRIYSLIAPVFLFMLINIYIQYSFDFFNFSAFFDYNLIFGRPCEIWLGVFAYFLCRRKNLKYPHLFGVLFFVNLSLFILSSRPHWIAFATFFAICYLNFKQNGFVVKVLGISILRTVGMLSYSIYIWHLLIVNIYEVAYIHFYRQNPEMPLISFLLVMVVSIFVAYFSYKFFEMPVKSKLIAKFQRSVRS
jgi:peptidoglycan/LPS O-acetylase OafA/YrhL